MSHPKYKPARLATLPPTLDPAEYDISPEARKAQAERLAIRSRLKREYLLQYNNPSRHGLIVSGGRWAGIAGRSWDAALRPGSPDPPGGLAGGGRHSDQCRRLRPRPGPESGTAPQPFHLGQSWVVKGREGLGTHTPGGAEFRPGRFPPDDVEKVTQLGRPLTLSFPTWERGAALLSQEDEIRSSTRRANAMPGL